MRIFTAICVVITFFASHISLSQQLVLQNGHSKEIKKVSFSPDGKYFVTVGGDENLKVYTKDGYLLHTFTSFKSKYMQGVFSADSKRYFTSSFSHDSLYCINLSTLKIEKAIDVNIKSKDYKIRGIGLSPDKKSIHVLTSQYLYENKHTQYAIIKVTAEGEASIRNTGIHQGDGYGSLFSPNGQYLLHQTEDRKKVLFHTATETTSDVVLQPYSPIQFTSSGEQFYDLVSTKNEEEHLAELTIYTSATGKVKQTVALAQPEETDEYAFKASQLNFFYYYPTANTIVLQGHIQYKGAFFLFYNMQGELKSQLFLSKEQASTFALSPKGERLVVCTGSPGANIKIGLQLYYFKDYVHELIKRHEDLSEIYQLSFTPDNQSFVVGQKNGLSVVTLTGKVTHQEVKSAPTRFTYSNANHSFFSTGKYYSLFQYTKDYLKTKEYKIKGLPNLVSGHDNHDIVVSIDGKNVYGVSTKNKKVVFEKDYTDWNKKTGKYITAVKATKDHILVFGPQTCDVLDLKGNVVKHHEYGKGVQSNFISNRPMSAAGEYIVGQPYFNSLTIFKTDGTIHKELKLPFIHFKHNSATSTCISADALQIAIGDAKGVITIINTEGQIQKRLNRNQNDITAITYSKDGKYMLSGTITGKITLWDVKNNYVPLVDYYIFDQKKYLAITPEGYYHASKEALDKFIYVKKGEVYPFDNFDLIYNRPDLVMDKLITHDTKLKDIYKRAYQKRLKRLALDESKLKVDFEHLPQVTLPKTEYYQKSKEQMYVFDIEVVAETAPLQYLMVHVNGVPVYGVQGLDLKNKMTFTTTCTTLLNSGKNIVTVSAIDNRGVESYKQKFVVDYKRSYEPTLHLLLIGASTFQDEKMNLTYAAKDAEDLARLYKKQNKSFSKVKVTVLTNEKVTKANVLKEIAALQKTDPDDAILVHVSTHGILDHELNYYLAMYDMDFNHPTQKGLSYEALDEALSHVGARHKILLLDACHSGEVDVEGFESTGGTETTDGKVKFRSFGTHYTTNVIHQESMQVCKEVFSEMKRTSGTYVISSAGAAEYAMEGDKWKNGVFTYCLLKGLQSGEADEDFDENITLNELKEYILQEVYFLTDGGQKPTIRIGNPFCETFRVW